MDTILIKQEKWGELDDFATKCISLAPEVSEYQFYAGLGAFLRRDLSACKEFLRNANDLNPEQEIYRLVVLKTINEKITKKKELETQLKTLIKNYQAMDYFESIVLPKIERMEKSKR